MVDESSDNHIDKSEKEWESELTSEQYQVCRLKGTEAPFSGKYNDFKGVGTFVCVCCKQPLFKSDSKFNSGTGWPSFFIPVSEDSIESKTDTSHGMSRTEVLCGKCGSHLGHVFPDGPAPTGLRYCINSVSLDFEPDQGE